MKDMKRLIIRGKTNDGDKAKQYCFLTEDKEKGFEPAVIIRRLILTDQKDDYLKLGHYLIREWKGKYVFGKSYSIKVSTMKTILKWVNI
jgi:hypothetical protein